MGVHLVWECMECGEWECMYLVWECMECGSVWIVGVYGVWQRMECWSVWNVGVYVDGSRGSASGYIF